MATIKNPTGDVPERHPIPGTSATSGLTTKQVSDRYYEHRRKAKNKTDEQLARRADQLRDALTMMQQELNAIEAERQLRGES